MLIHSEYERFRYGLTYYKDLIAPLNYDDALNIYEIIKKMIINIDANCVFDMVGGFRRFYFFYKFYVDMKLMYYARHFN